MLSTSGAELTLFGDISMGASQAREKGQNGKRAFFAMRAVWDKHGECHRRTRRRAVMAIHTLCAAIGFIEGEGFHIIHLEQLTELHSLHSERYLFAPALNYPLSPSFEIVRLPFL